MKKLLLGILVLGSLSALATNTNDVLKSYDLGQSVNLNDCEGGMVKIFNSLNECKKI